MSSFSSIAFVCCVFFSSSFSVLNFIFLYLSDQLIIIRWHFARAVVVVAQFEMKSVHCCFHFATLSKINKVIECFHSFCHSERPCTMCIVTILWWREIESSVITVSTVLHDEWKRNNRKPLNEWTKLDWVFAFRSQWKIVCMRCISCGRFLIVINGNQFVQYVGSAFCAGGREKRFTNNANSYPFHARIWRVKHPSTLATNLMWIHKRVRPIEFCALSKTKSVVTISYCIVDNS